MKRMKKVLFPPAGEVAPLCACGCGKSTKFRHNEKKWNDYIAGHGRRSADFHTRSKGEPPLCRCGLCDERVTWSKTSLSWNRYVRGHNRTKSVQERERAYGPRPSCKCGCGELTEWNTQTTDWYKYAKGHRNTAVQLSGDAPLCACGCGLPVKGTARGWNKYINRHALRSADFHKQPMLRNCKCGCGQIPGLNNNGKQRIYVAGHIEAKGLWLLASSTPALCKCGCGQNVEWDGPRRRWFMYVRGHQHNHSVRATASAVPPMCKCGCNQRVNQKGLDGAWRKHLSGHKGAGYGRPPIGSVAPVCACNCGQQVTWHVGRKTWNTYIMGHSLNTDKARNNLAESRKRPDYISKMMLAHGRKPNKLESKFDNLTSKNISFVGDGTFFKTWPIGRRKNPDFIVADQRRIIELFGDYWHKGDDVQLHMEMWKRIGYECLIIWEHELHEDQERILDLVSDFIGEEARSA